MMLIPLVLGLQAAESWTADNFPSSGTDDLTALGGMLAKLSKEAVPYILVPGRCLSAQRWRLIAE